MKLKTPCGKFLGLALYFPYDVKLRLLAHSRSFLASQKARNAIVGAENLLNTDILLRTKGPKEFHSTNPNTEPSENYLQTIYSVFEKFYFIITF